MHILVHESSQSVMIGTTSDFPLNATKITSPLLRPRLEGARGALRGDAFSAKFADTAQVLFTVRLPTPPTGGTQDVLNNYKAVVTIFQSQLLGSDPNVQYPNISYDVSGVFALDGHVAVDVALHGVCRVELALTRVTDPGLPATKSLFVLCQVLAEERAVDVEKLLHDRGEA